MRKVEKEIAKMDAKIAKEAKKVRLLLLSNLRFPPWTDTTIPTGRYP